VRKLKQEMEPADTELTRANHWKVYCLLSES